MALSLRPLLLPNQNMDNREVAPATHKLAASEDATRLEHASGTNLDLPAKIFLRRNNLLLYCALSVSGA
jgi:hypothetical protein